MGRAIGCGRTIRPARFAGIDINEEISAIRRLCVRATERSKPYGRHQKAAKKCRAILIKTALGKVHQKHSAVVHDPSDVQVLFGLGEDAEEQRIGEVCPYLVVCRSDSVSAISERKALKFLFQKSLHSPIFQ